MKPKPNEAKNDFLKRCATLAMENGESKESGFAWCNRCWEQKDLAAAGVELLSKDKVQPKDFDQAVQQIMAAERLEVMAACRLASERYPNLYEEYSMQFQKDPNDIDIVIADKAAALAENEGLSIEAATERILEENPDLAARYREELTQ